MKDDIQSKSTPSTNSTGNKSRTSTSSGEDTSKESQKSTIGARATDSARLMKFTKALSGPTVILGILLLIFYPFTFAVWFFSLWKRMIIWKGEVLGLNMFVWKASSRGIDASDAVKYSRILLVIPLSLSSC